MAVLDADARSRAAIRHAVVGAGGSLIAEHSACVGAKPDITVVAVLLPDGDAVQVASETMSVAACPVVLMGAGGSAALMARAREAGVMAFVLTPLRPGQLAPTLDLAVARFEEMRELKQALEDRKVIERAKGCLMQRAGMAEDQAYRHLRPRP